MSSPLDDVVDEISDFGNDAIDAVADLFSF